MATWKLKDATKKKIKARLVLAQELLEESDKLLGFDGYNYGEQDWWLHPRHTREALVIYLLLTCFDLLGQPENDYISLDDWLESEEQNHIQERQSVASGVQGIRQAMIALAKKHQEIYAIRKSFYQGIDRVPPEIKTRFLDGIRVSHCPDYSPNMSMPGHAIANPEELNRLRLGHLYRKRNTFTHGLEQYHRLSHPSPLFDGTPGAAWLAFIRNGKLQYANGHQDDVGDGKQGKYFFQFNDWPFILFEALYAAIGMSFHAHDIKLKFLVRFFSDDGLSYREINNVDHRDLVELDKNPFFLELSCQLNRNSIY